MLLEEGTYTRCALSSLHMMEYMYFFLNSSMRSRCFSKSIFSLVVGPPGRDSSPLNLGFVSLSASGLSPASTRSFVVEADGLLGRAADGLMLPREFSEAARTAELDSPTLRL